MRVLLHALLLRLELEAPSQLQSVETLPQAYVDYQRIIERRLRERPSVRALARELGYSPRTLDRACLAVRAKTAKETLDEQMNLEIKRLLVGTNRSISEIGHALGFDDPSNFTNYVKRHFGQAPFDVRGLASREID